MRGRAVDGGWGLEQVMVWEGRNGDGKNIRLKSGLQATPSVHLHGHHIQYTHILYEKIKIKFPYYLGVHEGGHSAKP